MSVSVEAVKALFPPHVWPRLPPAQNDTFPSKLPPQQSTKQLDRPQNPSETQSSQIYPQDTPGKFKIKVPSKSPPSSCMALIHSTSNLTVSDRIKKSQYGVEPPKHLDKSVGTPSSQRMDVDTPSPLELGARMQAVRR